jgi:hypothetical protein
LRFQPARARPTGIVPRLVWSLTREARRIPNTGCRTAPRITLLGSVYLLDLSMCIVILGTDSAIADGEVAVNALGPAPVEVH